MTRRIDNRPGKVKRIALPAAAAAAGLFALTACASDGGSAGATAPRTPASAPANPATTSEAPKPATDLDPTSAEPLKLAQQLSELAKRVSTSIATASSQPSQGLEITENPTSDGSIHATNSDSLGGSGVASYDFQFMPQSDTSGYITVELMNNMDVQLASETMPAGANISFSFNVHDGAGEDQTFTNLRSTGKYGPASAFTFANAFNDTDEANMTLTNITFGNGEGQVVFAADETGLHYSNMNYMDTNGYDLPPHLTADNADQTYLTFQQLTKEFTDATLQ